MGKRKANVDPATAGGFTQECHEALIQANKTMKPVYLSNGGVMLPDIKKTVPIDYALPYNSWQNDILRMLSRKNDEAGDDTIEEFYDFGPPSDQWDEFQSPYEVPEYSDNAGYYEDVRIREHFNPSQQPSVEHQEAEGSSISVSEELSQQESTAAEPPQSDT